jgi:hypothetical protein
MSPTSRERSNVVTSSTRSLRSRLAALAALATFAAGAVALLLPSGSAIAQRYLTERVIKGVQIQGEHLRLQTGFVAEKTGPNEMTIRSAGDAKSVNGKLECDCSAAKKAGCGVEAVNGEIVCASDCKDGCKVKPRAGWKLK